MNKILRVFLETDMRNQHDGLRIIAKEKDVHLDDLEPGEHVIFVNREMTRLKMFSAMGLLSYIKRDKGIDMNVIEEIPKCFSARGGVDWKKAERLSLDRKLGKRFEEDNNDPPRSKPHRRSESSASL